MMLRMLLTQDNSEGVEGIQILKRCSANPEGWHRFGVKHVIPLGFGCDCSWF